MLVWRVQLSLFFFLVVSACALNDDSVFSTVREVLAGQTFSQLVFSFICHATCCLSLLLYKIVVHVCETFCIDYTVLVLVVQYYLH